LRLPLRVLRKGDLWLNRIRYDCGTVIEFMEMSALKFIFLAAVLVYFSISILVLAVTSKDLTPAFIEGMTSLDGSSRKDWSW
jgi:hypothetical protein